MFLFLANQPTVFVFFRDQQLYIQYPIDFIRLLSTILILSLSTHTNFHPTHLGALQLPHILQLLRIYVFSLAT